MKRVGLMEFGLALSVLMFAGGCGNEQGIDTAPELPPPVVQPMQIVPDSRPPSSEQRGVEETEDDDRSEVAAPVE